MKWGNNKQRRNTVDILLLILCLMGIHFLEQACCAKFVIKAPDRTEELLFRWDCFTIGGAIVLTILQYICFDRRSDAVRYLRIMLYFTGIAASIVICLLLACITFSILNVPFVDTIALFVVQFILLTARIIALLRYKKRHRKTNTGDSLRNTGDGSVC